MNRVIEHKQTNLQAKETEINNKKMDDQLKKVISCTSSLTKASLVDAKNMDHQAN